MDPTQHPILSIFEEDTNIDLNIAFNEIDILRFNKILISLILETSNFDIYELIRSNLQRIVDMMNDRTEDIKTPLEETLDNLNHNRLYCINNKDHMDFAHAYKYKNNDLIIFLNTKWRMNKDNKVVYKESDFDIKESEAEITETQGTKRKAEEVENLVTPNDTKKQKVEEVKEEVEEVVSEVEAKEESHVSSDDEPQEESPISSDDDAEEKQNTDIDTEEVDEVRTFRSGRKVTRANAEAKPDDSEKPTQEIEDPTEENKTVKRTLRRGRTRGTVDDEDKEEEKKEPSPAIRTRRSLRTRK